MHDLTQDILNMQARAAAAVVNANACTDLLLAALAQYSSDMHARAARVARFKEKQLDDSAAEAYISAKQWMSWAALLKHAAHDVLDAPPMFTFEIPTNGHVLVMPAGIDVSSLHRVVSEGIDVARSNIYGQGLTAFDPSDTIAARQQNVICILPCGADGGVVEWVTASDIHMALTSQSSCGETTLAFEVFADNGGWRVVYVIGGSASTVELQICVHTVPFWQGRVQAGTPTAAVARIMAIKLETATVAYIAELVSIAAAFPDNADINGRVLNSFMFFDGNDLLAAGAHCTAMAAIDVFSTNASILNVACKVLYLILLQTGTDAICASDDTFINKLRHASEIVQMSLREV